MGPGCNACLQSSIEKLVCKGMAMGDSSFPGRKTESIARPGAPEDLEKGTGRDQWLSRDHADQDDEMLGEDLLFVAARIKSMPDLDPPTSLLPSIMQAVKSKKRPWWYRLSRWARAPVSITFTPLRVLPAAAMLVAVCLASVFFVGTRGGQVPREAKLDTSASRGQDLVPVSFSLHMPEAGSVAVVGSFNDWHPKECSMRRDREMWTATLHLPSGRYEYAFMVDGKSIVPDPGAHIHQDDGFGNQNAVLIVGNHDETAI